MKLFLASLSFLILINATAQKLQSPDEYLGYVMGTKYTPHYKIVEYFNYVAKTEANHVKFTSYGKTNEGRSLNLAFISSEDNIKNIDNIKAANLQRAKLQTGNTSSNVSIVWLSYNVHGNEPSSSEAAMMTIYNLLKDQKNGWLKNTLVIIDPCLNPDGRDRYVNWFNGVVGDYPNPNQNAREHMEPWPGGRLNHYYFDLNRDWAWQTQVETQQRIKVYNQWLPHVHVDFHEQGINEPYYFAPAAEPMHEVITPWQREFQTTIGKNNSKYFDEKGWFYFTKERFDLFYPSYGDTYPTYNGSIGMTYEQGGHSRGGLTVQMDNGDTLTLVDRVQHHYTTGMSTVEVTSQNTKAVLDNFSNYYNNSINSVGSNYKTYVITANSKSKLVALKKLLQSNGIEFSNINKVAGIGFNYANNKEENIVLQKYSIAVSAYQSKSLLAKVLLEPKSKLSDTATYDITAWSAPYAYGVQAYASTTKLVTQTEPISATTNASLPNTNYAYYVPYKSIADAKLLSQLISQKVKVYINEKDIITKGQKFAKGTIMIPKAANNKVWKSVTDILKNSSAEVVAVESGFVDKGPDMGSPDNKFITAPRIACVTNTGSNANASGEIWHFYDRELNYPITMLNSETLRLRTLKNFDVLILPDGYYSNMDNKTTADEIKTWVKLGGRIIAIEGAANQLINADWGNKIKKEDSEKKKIESNDVPKYENRERDAIVDYIPGAIYEVSLDNSHPLAFGYDNIYYTLKQNSDVIEFTKDAWNVGLIKKNKVVSGFAGANVLQKIKDGTVLSVQEMGSGSIIYFIDNPIFRNFWENGKLLFFNAAFLVGNNAVRL
jgi:hypothetical protein